MLELRWVLLGLGLLAFAGVYLWTVFSRRSRTSDGPPAEAEISTRDAEVEASHAEEADAGDSSSLAGAGDLHQPQTPPHDTPGIADLPSVVTLRFIPGKGEQLDTQQTIAALRKAGLRYGPHGIFHFPSDEIASEADFSVASLLEPGTFDLASATDTTLPGMTFFMVLPGRGDPVRRFDRMVGIARGLAQSLDAGIFDEQGSTWSIQRERFVREELIEFRRRVSRA